MLELIAETESRRIAAREGFGSTQRLVAGMLQLSGAEARMRVEHAAMVGTRRSLTGQTLPPRVPATSAALAAGEIDIGQLRVIAEVMTALPASVPEAARAQAEATLAGYARDFDPRRLRIIAHRMLAVLDPDGPEPADDPTTPAREELRLRDRRDGRLALEGWLDPEHGSMVRALIEQPPATPPPTARPTRAQSPSARPMPSSSCVNGLGPPTIPHHRRRAAACDGHDQLGGPADRAGRRHPGLRADDQRRCRTPAGV